MTRLYVLWAFVQWCFRKMFSGCFNKAESFRYELKKGAPDSIFACFAFVALSALVFVTVSLVTLFFVDDRKTGQGLMIAYMAAIAFTFIYNVIVAAFECFEDERRDLLEHLKQ